MVPSNGFVGVVCAVYLFGGFILGGIALALQSVVSQFAKRSWVRILPLGVGVSLWLAMVVERIVGIGGDAGSMVSGLYTAFGGWVYPYDLLAFSMSTVPVLAGLVTGFVINRAEKSAVPEVTEF